MEWVETTARSIDEAKSIALDQLGVDEHDAEFEIIDEPRAGLFGRVRGEARVRARVRPTQARPKVERRDRKKRSDPAADGSGSTGGDDSSAADPAVPDDGPSRGGGRKPAARGAGSTMGRAAVVSAAGSTIGAPSELDGNGSRSSRPAGQRTRKAPTATNAPHGADQETVVDAEQVGDEAQRFIEALVTAFGLEGTTTVRCEGDEIDVNVEGTDLGVLVGPRGTTLQAVQELARVAAQRRLGDHETRLRVDVGGYRERRREALTRFALQLADQVVGDGSAKRLEPMSSSDRKVIHDVLSDVDGVVTHSEGEDPRRCVVIAPSNA